MIVQGGSAAQERARNTAAMTALEDYKSAFNSAMLTWPGMMKDREESWGTDGSTYTGATAFKKLVGRMNETLDLKLQLTWDDTTKCWKSQSPDPWGGNYILTEFPMAEGDTDGVSPLEGKGLSAMRLSIWASGSDDGLLVEKKVSEKSVGISLDYHSGYVYDVYNGTQKSGTPYVDFKLDFK